MKELTIFSVPGIPAHRCCRRAVLIVAIVLGLVVGALGSTVTEQSSETRQLLSRLQSMSQGYRPAREWNRVIEEIHELVRASEERGNFEQMIDVTGILANVYSHMLSNHPQGIKVLMEMKERLAQKETKGMPKIYARLAEVYARMGEEEAITRLIEEFRAGKYYDPKEYSVTPAEQYGEAWEVERPHGQGENSLTVSAMKKSLREARFAPGREFPDLAVTTVDGRKIRISSLRGKVVLVDFWIKDWTAWNRDLPHLVRMYDRHHAAGFEIIGVSVHPGLVARMDFLNRQGVSWPQAEGSREIFSACGVTGDATNFLLDPDGVIIARDVRSNQLTYPIRDCLKQ